MSPVDQFLQHGTLPFVGRVEEQRRLLEFQRGTVDAGRLRVGVLSAEAGSGKSRLLEETVGLIEAEGGVVVHAKLYPEAANDLGVLLARALRNTADARRLLGERSAETIAEAIAGLQRLSRLRPLIVVLEDLHLLAEEAIGDLGALLGGLADETLSILALARPVRLRARGVLERYLTETIEMKGLTREEIALLWSALFAEAPKEKHLTILEQETFGNGLALRSALRAALGSGSIVPRGTAGAWRVAVPDQELESVVRQGVNVAVEGLVAQLSPSLRRSAASLATLGEVFARESAERLLGSSEELDRLLATDLLVVAAHPIPPLPGFLRDPESGAARADYPASRLPLFAFTHSLLHSHLAEEGTPDIPALCALLAENYPLYSLLPFRLLRDAAIPPSVEGELLNESVQRTLVVSQLLERTSNWREGLNVWETMRHLVDHLEGRVPVEEYNYRRIMRATIKLSLWRREIGSEEWLRTLDEAMALTESMEEERIAFARFLLVSHWFEWYSRHSTATFAEAAERTRPIVERYPSLEHSLPYIYHLDALAGAATRWDDRPMMRELEARIRAFAADPALTPHLRSNAVYRLLKHTFFTVETPEDVAEREELFRVIEEEIDEEEAYYGMSKSSFLMFVGRFADAADLAERAARSCRDRGVWLNYMECVGTRTICSAALGEPFDRLMARSRALRADAHALGISDLTADMFAVPLLSVALFTLPPDPLPRIVEALEIDPEEIPLRYPTMLALLRGDEAETRRMFAQRRESDPPVVKDAFVDEKIWSAWAAYADGGWRDVAAMTALLDAPVARLHDVMRIRGTVRLLRMADGDPRDTGAARERSAAAIEEALRWLVDRDGVSFAPPLIALLDDIGADDAARRWRERVEGGAHEETPAATSATETPMIRVSMLGTIRIAVPPEEYVPLRGVRIRTLLGLMVADRMIPRALSAQEFVRLAGDDDDPEHARKKKNMGVVRLREIMGRDAILTDGDAPTLNRERVEVDILTADRLFAEALAAATDGALVKALPLLLEGLRIVGTEVPFPTLYDDFFEAVREDFEHRLRNAVLATARGLIEQGDPDRSEELLRAALTTLPGDEEVAELLQQVLTAAGNRVEAERVRMEMAR